MTKKILLIICVLSSISVVHSQDLIKEIQRLTLENDSLQKLVKAERSNMLTFQKNNKALNDTVKTLRSDLSKLEKFKIEKNSIDNLLKQKSDSITLLRANIAKANRQLTEERQRGEQKSKNEYEKGKREVLDVIVDTYKNKVFDELINSSTKLSVERDLHIVGNNVEIKPILANLQKYFEADELLKQKYNAVQITNALTVLNQIKQQSTILDKLKENIEFYVHFNGALKSTVESLIILDEKETVTDEKTRKDRFNKIIAGLSDYMYNYYDYNNYSYLSDIVLEIIKRKKPDPDADIIDLLNKL